MVCCAAATGKPAFTGRYGLPAPLRGRSSPDRPNPVDQIAERKLRRCQLTEDGNVEITGRDLRDGAAGR